MEKKKALEKVQKEMEADSELPLINKPEDIIPGHGNPNAQIVFIGEAGGFHEQLQRKPFVGRAGKFLDQLLESIQIKREDVYITNMVKTRPPQNRDPLPEELAAYSRYLDEELDIIQPEVIVTLGRFSMSKFLPGVYISNVHGKPRLKMWHGRKTVIVPMYHPAAGLRNGTIRKQTFVDFKEIPRVVKKLKDLKQESLKEQKKVHK